MNHPLSSIKQILLCRLQAGLGLYIPDASVLNQRSWHISLHRAKDCSCVLYVSAIAFQLSQFKNIPPLEIANALATLVRGAELSVSNHEVECCCEQLSLAPNILQEFTVEVVPPGWIHLEVTEPAIAAWLQSLVSPLQVQNWFQEEHCQLTPTDTSRLFAVQYTHARCCSLVQMAHREKIITLKAQLDTSSTIFLVTPDPIPWLNHQKLRCCHPAERELIGQLLETLDELCCPCTSRQPIDWEKAALNLSQAFQTFYSCCRIWGEVKINSLELAQARLGIVIATQSVLRLLLQSKLGVPAPLEL